MHRREFIATLAGAVSGASAFGLGSTSAQQPAKVRRIGVLMGTNESDSGGFFAAFVEELARFGWRDNRNLQIELRWSAGDADRIATFATELVGAQPDVIFCSATVVTAALHRETTTIPIVFAIVGDPVGAGFVASLARPGGNITGFTSSEPAMGGKWLSLLKEIAPGIKRAAFMLNPETAPGGGKHYLASFEAAAGSLGIEPVAMPVRSDAEIETAIAALGAEQSGLVEFSPFLAAHIGTVISSTARHKVPAIFEGTQFARKGGLIAYGVSFTDMFRRAATYVDRILRGERPADLPVQTPTKFEMIINLQTARALGLNVPPRLLATADEVIE